MIFRVQRVSYQKKALFLKLKKIKRGWRILLYQHENTDRQLSTQ